VHTPTRLDDSGHGRWRVTTQTSAHLIDLDRRAVTRIEGAGTPTTDAGWLVSSLRCDREFVELVELVRCEVGCEMEMLLQIRDDCSTLRLTTEVVVINPA